MKNIQMLLLPFFSALVLGGWIAFWVNGFLNLLSTGDIT